jgi:predicted alpha/beta hydrolase family esterase
MSSASQNIIHERANNLLVDLSDLRTTASDRSIPLIFVAHSLGGIVAKDALNLSTSTEGTR